MEFFLVTTMPFVMAFCIMLIRRSLSSPSQGGLLSAIFAVSFAILLTQQPNIQQHGAFAFSLPWMPQIGLALSFYVDGLALLFALVVTGIASMVFFYAGYYLDERQEAGRFFALLLAFTGSMLLLVMAGNLLTLFIAWELTSIISFLLISFKGTDPKARRGASQALVITGGGGLALLLGLLLIGHVAGSMEFSAILASGDALRENPLYTGFTLLVVLGCFAKSAQFPLHFWLPDAMSAPTPASAFLHSATMVKAGIYLLARFYPVLGDTEMWTLLLTGVGLTTLLLGALFALRQQDLKGMLAFSTISQLGGLVALIGLPHAEGLKAAMVGVIAHALYKCTLFLVVGAVDHATGTRIIHELGGLHRSMRGFAIVTAVTGLSMAGVPPLLGFVSKELLLESFLHHEQMAMVIIAVVSAILTVTLALRLFVDVFLGERPVSAAQTSHVEHSDHDPQHPLGDDADDYNVDHIPPPLMVAGPAILAGLSLILGLGVKPLLEPLIDLALGEDVSLYLFSPEGVNPALILSVTALILGAALFAGRRYWLSWSFPTLVTGPQLYRQVIMRIEQFADFLLTSQAGKIRYYLVAILTTVVFVLVTVVTNLERMGIQPLSIEVTSVTDALKALLLILSLGTTLASILFERHLLAALSLGIAGYAIGGIFLLEPAPDVALVQFLVETLSTVLIIVILARTSEEQRRKAMARLWGQTRRGLLRDLAISTGLGGAVMIFALAAISNRPTPDPIVAWHIENALPELGVNDIAAGIITDFRGMDTLIEITVFGMAALGILTLMARPNPGKTMHLFGTQDEASEASPVKEALQEDAEQPEPLTYRPHYRDTILRMTAVPILPISMMIALAQLLYAGAGPGDGFTAGVIAGLGVTLWFIVFGYEEAKRRLPWLYPAPMVGVGMLLAFVNAIIPLFFGRAFLAFTPVTGFSVANIKLASSLIFEIGISLAVFGGISAILEAINRPKEVEPL